MENRSLTPSKRFRSESVDLSPPAHRIWPDNQLYISNILSESSHQGSRTPSDAGFQDAKADQNANVDIQDLSLSTVSQPVHVNSTHGPNLSASRSAKDPEIKQQDDYVDNFYSEPRYICYGMICGIKATYLEGFFLNKDVFLETSHFTGPPQYVSIIPYQTYSAVRSIRYNTEFAVLQKHFITTLRDISNAAPLRLEAYVNHQEISASNSKDTDGNSNPFLTIEINISGPRELAKDVGKILSQARIYLQEPLHLDEDIEYDNPHFVKGLPSPQLSLLNSIPQISAPKVVTQVHSTQIHFVLQDLHEVDELPSTSPDPRVKTALLDHQLKALNFVIHREHGSPTEAFSLWKRCQSETQVYYEHIICGARKYTHAEEALGGILADEMGLGKTLSMISAITTSLDSANLYAKGGDDRGPTALLKTRATLVIAPSVVILDGWLADVKEHLNDGTLKSHRYHGKNKETNLEKLADHDLVLTTYATVSTERYRNSSKALQNISWFRIILDEAHVIRRQETKQFRAISDLAARHRWCLSGTPIQNHIKDLESLVSFLRIPHFNSKSDFQKHVVSPLTSGNSDPTRNLRLLLKSICLRRTQSLLGIPEATYMIQSLSLSNEENYLYQGILKSLNEEIDKAISSRSTSRGQSLIMQTWEYLRRICVQGTCCRKLIAASQNKSTDETFEVLQEGEEDDDVQEVAALSTEGSLPPLSSNFLSSQPNLKAPHSTKFFALVKNLEDKSATGKSIVFSGWKTTFNLLEPLLKDRGIQFLRIDGDVPSHERFGIISRFTADDNISVILMTTGTGSVGLNLTIATRVHLLEPQWNPSVESQAIGRVLRLTQKKAVVVIRYIMEGTIEMNVQERQTLKLELAELSLGEEKATSEQTLKRLTTMRSLLR